MIKYGGNAMIDDSLRAAFAEDLVFLRYAGLRPVVVHGGGPQITEHLDRLGLETTFTAGLRVTTPETMDVVRMVLTGKVNKDIVRLINRDGPFAVGLSGEDANMFTAGRKPAIVDGESVDIGLVGEIEATDAGAVRALIADRRIPVVSSVARGADGEVYNVNADTAAAALAVALGAAKLMILTDVPGLYRTWPDGDVLSEVGAGELETMLPAPEHRNDPQDGGVPDRGPRRRAPGPRARRPPAARRPAGDLHRFRHRHDGRPRRTGQHGKTRRGRATMSATEVMQKRFAAALMPNYGLPQLALARGEGCRVWDADGREYLDLFAGIAVSSLGHAHPALVGAVTGQVGALAHTSNLFLHEPGIALAERLLALLGPGTGPADARIFFANSGAEANEAAIKLGHWERGARAGTPRLRRHPKQVPRPHHGRARAHRQGVHP